MSELPTNPFIVPDSIDDTCVRVDSVLAFLQNCHESPYATDELTPSTNANWGMSYVIEGVRGAVSYMRDLGMPQNVTKLEGKS